MKSNDGERCEMLEFIKMHGIGNDYVYLDAIRQELPEDQTLLEEWARVLADRHFGIGGDGLILLLPSSTHDFRMRMFNADGTEGRMCGNGMRCLVKYAWDAGHTRETEVDVETLAGTIRSQLVLAGGSVASVRVDMGEPRFTRGALPMKGDPEEPADNLTFRLGDGVVLEGSGVSMGNAHTVFFVDDIESVPLDEWGPLVEWDERFPERTNVEFIEPLEPGHLRMRVWERGSGITLACGTGACASLAAAHRRLGLPREATITLDGGTLLVSWSPDNNHLYMTGPAETVFHGSCDIDALVEGARARAAELPT